MKTFHISLLTIIFLTFIFAGCSTRYQPSGFGGGYSETRLGENIFNVSFRGNGYTSMEKTTDFVLLRSSELALQNNYKFFAIVNADNHNTITTTAKSYTTNGTFTSSNYTATTTESGGQTFVKPSSRNTIMCFKEKPQNIAIIYDAEYIITSIKQKYDIP